MNFSIPELFLKADLKLLGHKLANAALSAGKKGVKAEAGAEMEVSLLDCSIGGGVDFGISANTVRIEGTFGISGHLEMCIRDSSCSPDGFFGVAVSARGSGGRGCDCPGLFLERGRFPEAV